jgi:IclR family transcriptional regulator, acetate operon repressor
VPRGRPDGLPLAQIADELEMPRSLCHRLLADLQQRGYVRQPRAQGDYAMTIKLMSLGLAYLSTSGIVDIAEPPIERVAQLSGELVRLAIIDGDRLTWVAKSQGARKGLRYDPDMGTDARLSCTATGHAWLLTLSDERALELVSQQGFGTSKDYGPNAPTTVQALLKMLHAARERGWSMIDEVFAPGMTAMAAPVCERGKAALGVISIAGPLARLSVERMHTLAPALQAAADLAATHGVSACLGGRRWGRGDVAGSGCCSPLSCGRACHGAAFDAGSHGLRHPMYWRRALCGQR